MQGSRLLQGIAAALVAVLASAALPAAQGAALGGAAAPRTRVSELIYVTGSGPGVSAYAAASRGLVRAVRSIRDPHLANTFWDPWGVAFDRTGHLYVQSFLSEATTFVFPPNDTGTKGPVRIFRAQAPDSQSIAVDSQGFAYVAGGQGTEAIFVVRPGAAGRPVDGYSVNPVRTIPLAENFNPWPDMLTVNARNQILVAQALPRGNEIDVFGGGKRGATKALRVISGRRTGLGSCATSTFCDEVSIAFSARTGLIYVAVSNGAEPAHISVFAGNARGNARPIRTIEGRATGLAGHMITGLAVSQLDGTIYAMVKASFAGPARVYAFKSTARGDARPLRSFTDRGSQFRFAEGIAIVTIGRAR